MPYKVDTRRRSGGLPAADARRLRLGRRRRYRVLERLGGRLRRVRRLAAVRAGAGADALSAGAEAGSGPAVEAGVVGQYACVDRVYAGELLRDRLMGQQVLE